MANNEVLVIPSPELHLPGKNSSEEIEKRKTSFLKSVEDLLGSSLNSYKDLSLPEVEKEIANMEGVPTSVRQPNETAEVFILKAWKEEKGSRKVNLYLWLLDKVYPQELEYLMIVDEKNRNKIFLLRDQALKEMSLKMNLS